MIWFKFYATDWLADLQVQLLTSSQRGVYIDLLAYSASEGGGFTCEPEEFARVRQHSEDDVRLVLERHFDRDSQGAWRNDRLEDEREKFDRAQQARSQGGKATAAARAGKKATSSKASSKARSQGKPWEAMVDEFPEGAREAFREFAAYRDEMKKPLTAAGIRRFLKKPAPQLVSAFSEAIECGWQGPQFKNWTAEGQRAGARGAGTVDPFGHLDTLDDDDLPRVIDAEVVQ